MPNPTVQQIEERVTQRENAFGPLFSRMDADWSLYNLDPFRPKRGDGIRQEDAFTSNRPKIVADKLTGAIASAKQIIRVEVDAENEKERDQNNNYERFAIGALRMANKRRVSSGGSPIKTELGFRAITAGGYVSARALLRKDEKGETIVDVVPIHPRHLLIQMGAGEPQWAAIVTIRNRSEIRSEYRKFKFDDDEPNEDSQRTEKVIDYYWKDLKTKKYMNAVAVSGKWAKKPADTHATMFPIVARAVGAHSGTSGVLSLSENASSSSTIPGIETFGESIFAPIRLNNRFKNRVMSYHMTVTRKRVSNIHKVFSSGGTKELGAALDEDASELNLDVDNNEDVVPLELTELSRDAGTLLQLVNIEEADGSLPEQSFGRLPAPISGNALAILGSSVGERLEPFIRPVESCIEGIIEALAGQFETEHYKPIRVSGKTRNRQGFSRELKPSDIKDHDDIMVELEPDLPTDRSETWLTAQIATTQGADGVPLVSHLTAREDILKLQDADLESERIFAQKARMSSEKMVLMTQLVAARRRGDEQTVQFLEKDIQRIVTNEAMQEVAQQLAFMSLMQQSPLGAAAGGVNGAGGAGGGGQGPQDGQNPLRGVQPEFSGLSGVAPGSVQPSPDAGANTTGPRVSEEQANQSGITLQQG